MITLFEVPVSPYAQKVKLALLEKGLSFDTRLVDLTRPSDELRKLSPRVEVPVLVDGGFALADSPLICRYLAEQHGCGALYPSDPAARFGLRLAPMGAAPSDDGPAAASGRGRDTAGVNSFARGMCGAEIEFAQQCPQRHVHLHIGECGADVTPDTSAERNPGMGVGVASEESVGVERLGVGEILL